MPEPRVLPEPVAVLLSGVMLGVMALVPVEVLGSGMEVDGLVRGAAAGVTVSSTFLPQAPSASAAARAKAAKADEAAAGWNVKAFISG